MGLKHRWWTASRNFLPGCKYRLNHPLPWIPYRRGNLWVIFGHPIEPRPNPNRRAARFEMADELRRQFQSLAEELRTRFDLPEDEVP